MLRLMLCCVRVGGGAYWHCCPPSGEDPAPPLRVDAVAADDDGGGGCYYYEELPVSTPPLVPRGLSREHDYEAGCGYETELTAPAGRGAPGLREDAEDEAAQVVSPSPPPSCGVVGSATSWVSAAIASFCERLSRAFPVLLP
ncbi:uncharacterized protein LOC121053537 [Oryza brachyantha]|uniref:uncharacterized protein LOC121053537 n=1 Tax=Oryza brachyantha TaxID=4533 RepID=UPI001AD95928|nr:uncharacterized protein LOC121053537 [Oryza brachyantha]